MYAQNKISICNLALGRIGAKLIQSFNPEEGTTPAVSARYCRLFYQECVAGVLRDFVWNFAESYQYGGLVEGIPLPPGFSYAFTLPSDFIHLRDVMDSSGKSIEFQFYYGSSRRVVATNDKKTLFCYTAYIDNPEVMPSDFVEALAWKLASLLAVPVKGRPDLIKVCIQNYQYALSRARLADSNESDVIEEYKDYYTEARN
ncbi:MAG: hypothetical protein K9M56_04265 [Victivallales bacterium]|nr:hypothetical protein [Victivallales bacterium]